MPSQPLDRQTLLATLDRLAPTHLAAGWDNVGLILEPPSEQPVSGALLTIDLTDAVVDEALELGVDVIVAYHPPIFSGLKRINGATPLGRRLLRLLGAGVAVWTPHTGLDSVAGGMCDWLLGGLGDSVERAPIEAADDDDHPGAGLGRQATLATPTTLDELTERLKAHLGLEHLRRATSAAHADGAAISRVAVCPGAGGSLFSGLPAPADGGPELYVTGEWRHHDVLAQVDRGASVILTDHSNTERGFLPVFAKRIEAALPGLKAHVSRVDQDPLRIV